MLSFVVLFILAGLWVITTPVSGSPDEPAHAAKAAGVVRGEGYGIAQDDVPLEKRAPERTAPDGTRFVPGNFRYFDVPEFYSRVLGENQICFAFKSDQTPTCDNITMSANSGSSDLVMSPASLYDPTFYVLVGWPSLIHEGYAGFYGMRIMNALLTSFCFSLGFAAVASLRKPAAMTAGMALIATPSTLFLGGTVNPNGLEIACTATFTATLLVAIEHRNQRAKLWWLMGIVAFMGVLQPHMRSLGFVWLGIATVAITLMTSPRVFFDLLRKPAATLATSLTIISCLTAIWQVTSTNVLTSTAPMTAAGSTFDDGFRMMLENIGQQMYSMVSLFGWMDTPGPVYIMFLYTGIAFALVACAIIVSRTWQTSGLWLAIFAYIFVPAVIQGISMKNSGFIWQGRYSMALFSVLILLAAVVVQPQLERLTGESAARLAFIFTIGIGCIHLVSLYTALHRYAVGVSGSPGTFLFHPAWLPPYLPLPTVGWIALFVMGCFGYTTVLLALMRTVDSSRAFATPALPPHSFRVPTNDSTLPSPEGAALNR